MNSPTPFNRRAILTCVIAATVVNILATTMYLPAIPAMARDLDSDIRSIQLLLTAYLVTSAAGQLLLGPLSDATGRRGLLIGGGLCSAIISLWCATAHSVGLLIGLRLLQGVTGSAFVVATRAVVRDMNDRSGTARDMAGILLAISFVAPVSQAIGGLLTDFFSWRLTFGVIAGASCVTFVLAWLVLRETNLARTNILSPRAYAASYAILLGSREFLAFAAINIVLFMTLYFFYNAFPIILIRDFDLSPTVYGPIALLCSSGMFLGSLFSNRMSVGRDPEWLLTVGISISGVAGAAMLFPLVYGNLSLPIVILIPFVWFVGYGISLPNAIAGAMSVHPAMAGAGAALLGFIQIAAGAVGSAVAGTIGSANGLFLTIGGLALSNVAVRLTTLRATAGPRNATGV